MSVQKKSLISNLAAAKKAMIARGRMEKPEQAGAVRTAVRDSLRQGVQSAVSTNVRGTVRTNVQSAVKGNVQSAVTTSVRR